MLIGWDTDQFPTDLYETATAMYTILRAGGFTTGGLNFDAKVRRQSVDPVDLFHAHIGGMDAFARGLKIAARMVKEGTFAKFIKNRLQGLGHALRPKDRKGASDLRTNGEVQPWPTASPRSSPAARKCSRTSSTSSSSNPGPRCSEPGVEACADPLWRALATGPLGPIE